MFVQNCYNKYHDPIEARVTHKYYCPIIAASPILPLFEYFCLGMKWFHRRVNAVFCLQYQPYVVAFISRERSAVPGITSPGVRNPRTWYPILSCFREISTVQSTCGNYGWYGSDAVPLFSLPRLLAFCLHRARLRFVRAAYQTMVYHGTERHRSSRLQGDRVHTSAEWLPAGEKKGQKR